jgi:hypothetical protein
MVELVGHLASTKLIAELAGFYTVLRLSMCQETGDS